MAIDWQKLVWANVDEIAGAAKSLAGENIVCTLMDADDARAGKVAPGMIHLIADVGLKRAVPLTDPEGKRRLICLPVPLDRLIKGVSKYEETNTLESRIRIGGTLATWAVCFDGDQRGLYNVHVASPEDN
jgi:hypothetical protein